MSPNFLLESLPTIVSDVISDFFEPESEIKDNIMAEEVKKIDKKCRAQYMGYDFKVPEDLLYYLQDKLCDIKTAENLDEDPYLVILYGPPGCGKSYAKNIILQRRNLIGSHLNINIDDFLYESQAFQKTIENPDFQKRVKKITSINDPGIENLVMESSKAKETANSLREILINIGLIFRSNIIIETTGSSIHFVERAIKKFRKSSYK